MFSRVLRSSANTARLRTRHVGGARKFSVPPKAAKPCNGKSQGSDDSFMNSIKDVFKDFPIKSVVLGVCMGSLISICNLSDHRTYKQNKEILRRLQYLIDKTDA